MELSREPCALVIHLEEITQFFGIQPELICYEHELTKALVGKPKANTVSVYPVMVLSVFTALAWSFGVEETQSHNGQHS